MIHSSDYYLGRIKGNNRQFLDELTILIQKIVSKWNWSDSSYTEDIVQDCFLKLIRNLEKGQFGGQSSFKTYVYALARNTCIDYFRASKLARTTDIDEIILVDTAPSQEDRLIATEERISAARVVRSLPRECRELWRIIFFGKRNYRQAAELLGLKEGTVKRKMWECRQSAKKLVAELE